MTGLTARDGDDKVQDGLEIDRLVGGAGDDIPPGAAEADTLTGGSGVDVFMYVLVTAMGTSLVADRITDFTSAEDQINLDYLPGPTFIGNAAFGSVAGQVRYGKAAEQLQLNHNGDGVGDFFLQPTPGTVLVAGDMIHCAAQGLTVRYRRRATN